MSAARTGGSCQETTPDTTVTDSWGTGAPRAFRAALRFWWQNGLVASRRRPGPFRDVAAVCGKDERGLHILRRRSEDGPIEAAIVEPLVEGKPLSGEVITMRRREDLPFLFDVTTEVALDAEPTATATSTGGPAQVATDSYRRGWEAIWGRRSRSGPLN